MRAMRGCARPAVAGSMPSIALRRIIRAPIAAVPARIMPARAARRQAHGCDASSAEGMGGVAWWRRSLARRKAGHIMAMAAGPGMCEIAHCLRGRSSRLPGLSAGENGGMLRREQGLAARGVAVVE